MKHLHSQSSNTPETLVFPFTHSTPNQNMRSLKFLTPFCLFFCQNATIEAKFQKNIKMPAPLINKGLHTISTGAPGGVRILFHPPLADNTNPRQCEFVLFFLRDCFGIFIPSNIPKYQSHTRFNYINQKRDKDGNFCK